MNVVDQKYEMIIKNYKRNCKSPHNYDCGFLKHIFLGHPVYKINKSLKRYFLLDLRSNFSIESITTIYISKKREREEIVEFFQNYV